MESCGVGVCPPSSVSYEYCSVKGLCFLKQTAGNQGNMLNYLTSNGLAFHFEEIHRVLGSANEYLITAIKIKPIGLMTGLRRILASLIRRVCAFK
jgi:hypothetical protein